MSTNVNAIVTVITFFSNLLNTVKAVTDKDSAGGTKITWLEDLQFISVAENIPAVVVAVPQIPAEINDTITADELTQIEDAIAQIQYLKAGVSALAAADDALKIINDIKNWAETYIWPNPVTPSAAVDPSQTPFPPPGK